eukprot:4486129-Amphidinium_carterae.1
MVTSSRRKIIGERLWTSGNVPISDNFSVQATLESSIGEVVAERCQPVSVSAGLTAGDAQTDEMTPIISFLEVARACTLTISVCGPNGAQLLRDKLFVQEFDGMVLEGPLEMQRAKDAFELQAMHPGELE